ncbi:metal-sulfur cluster assembly factor [Candidatus Uhrbacteria bacterium]|nr:metal-sulfur cluster assembly factor [Candidatus Uhrbacteria bacterium]
MKKITPTPIAKRTGPLWDALRTVLDPELGYSIVDLGLVYGVKCTNGRLVVTSTFTSMGCPAGPQIIRMIEEAGDSIPGITSVRVDVVWEPVWGPDMVNPDLGLLL